MFYLSKEQKEREVVRMCLFVYQFEFQNEK